MIIELEYYSHGENKTVVYINVNHIVSIDETSYSDGYGFAVKNGLSVTTIKRTYGLTEYGSIFLRGLIKSKRI